MGNLALDVQGLSKRYRIGAGDLSPTMSTSLVHAMRRVKRSVFGQPPPPAIQEQPDQGLFWALKDVSFQVKHGEAVGIIGRNGAGKSTLLKILSRITKPTSGHAEVYGRLGALLEVGTGFHPELTGRENIFLNATILGLDRNEVLRRFEEIVAFAEIEKFVDTPVKHYSSGMYMRLAFSVSAHLDPEILVLDEVLSVGDAAFQKKCLGKMEGVAKDGRTVLLVSHNIAAIMSFCDRCILLQDGRIIRDGDAASVSEFYQESQGGALEADPKVREMMDLAEKSKTQRATIRGISVTPLNERGEPSSVLRVGGDLAIEIGVLANQGISAACVTVSIFDSSGNRAIDFSNALKDDYLTLEAGMQAVLRFTMHNVLLRPGTYRIALWLGRPPTEVFDTVLSAADFSVEVNPRKTKYPHQFFGVYQCEFTHSVSIAGASSQSGDGR